MDSRVNGIGSGGIHGVQPTSKRTKKEKEPQKPFSLEQPEESPEPEGSEPAPENLPCSEREDDESGGTLDLTA